MSTPEDEAAPSEASFTYTPNYHNIFSSRGQSVTNGANGSISNNKRNDFASHPTPNLCNQVDRSQPLNQHQTQSYTLQYQPQQYQSQQQQDLPQQQPTSLLQSAPQVQPVLPAQPQNLQSSTIQYHLQQQHVHSSTQPLRLPHHQQNSVQIDARDNHIRTLSSDSNSNSDQSQTPSRSTSVPNLEQQPMQQPARNVSTSYINLPTNPVIQPPSAHQPITYQRPSDQVQSTPRYVLTTQNTVNQRCQQQSSSPNQQSSCENQRGQNQQPYPYIISPLQSSQQSQSRVMPNLNEHNYTSQLNYNSPQILRPPVQQVAQNQIPVQLQYNAPNITIRPQLQPSQLAMVQQGQQNQFPNPCHRVGVLLSSPPPFRPSSTQANTSNTTYDMIYAPPEIVNNPYLARALAPTRSSNVDSSQNLRMPNQPQLSSCNIRPPPTSASFNQVPTSNLSYSNCRWRLAQHVDVRRRNKSPQTTTSTRNSAITPSHRTTTADKQPSINAAPCIVTPNIPQTQSIGIQTQPETANKAMQFDGKLRSLESKALNATVCMEDKECQTDDTEDRPVTTKLFVDRACSPILSVGLTLLANSEPKSIPVRMKKTTKRKDLSVDDSETDKKIRKRESGSDTDVDIETLE